MKSHHREVAEDQDRPDEEHGDDFCYRNETLVEVISRTGVGTDCIRTMRLFAGKMVD